ncbi:MAG: class II aldolase/adducin family protein [Caldilineaceae bacterium]
MNLNVSSFSGEASHAHQPVHRKVWRNERGCPSAAHSQDLADAVVESLTAPRCAAKNGLGLILNWHGVVTVGRDLLDAYDTLERLEWSAYALLHQDA